MLSELSNKDKLRLLPLLNHTGVSVSPYDKESYLVRFNGVEWVLWLDDKQWASIEGKKPSKEIYYGDLDTFIQKTFLSLSIYLKTMERLGVTMKLIAFMT